MELIIDPLDESEKEILYYIIIHLEDNMVKRVDALYLQEYLI